MKVNSENLVSMIHRTHDMRILGVTEKWDKLKQPQWTTFRFTRKDRDWQVGETVQVIYKPRKKGGGERLGIAKIIGKEPRWVKPEKEKDIPSVSEEESKTSGFHDKEQMIIWMAGKYGIDKIALHPMNKLTLHWL